MPDCFETLPKLHANLRDVEARIASSLGLSYHLVRHYLLRTQLRGFPLATEDARDWQDAHEAIEAWEDVDLRRLIEEETESF